jgi:hypothetical protein
MPGQPGAGTNNGTLISLQARAFHCCNHPAVWFDYASDVGYAPMAANLRINHPELLDVRIAAQRRTKAFNLHMRYD